MDNFMAIYKILSRLEKAMDYSEFDISQISASSLKVSEERWARYIEMMLDVGYIKGVSIVRNVLGEINIEDDGIRITLKGLEYLNENTFMKRAYRTARGVTEVVPTELNSNNH